MSLMVMFQSKHSSSSERHHHHHSHQQQQLQQSLQQPVIQFQSLSEKRQGPKIKVKIGDQVMGITSIEGSSVSLFFCLH